MILAVVFPCGVVLLTHVSVGEVLLMLPTTWNDGNSRAVFLGMVLNRVFFLGGGGGIYLFFFLL